jgi:hypothetical protein
MLQDQLQQPPWKLFCQQLQRKLFHGIFGNDQQTRCTVINPEEFPAVTFRLLKAGFSATSFFGKFPAVVHPSLLKSFSF